MATILSAGPPLRAAHAQSAGISRQNGPDLSDSINQFGAFGHSAPLLAFLYSAWAYPARCVTADTIRGDTFSPSYPDAS